MEPTAGDSAAARGMSPFLVAIITATAWYVLLGQDPASWMIGVPCVALAALSARGMPSSQRARISLVGWARLLVYFLYNSLIGGWDVARRVVVPGLPLDPGYVDLELHLPEGPARTFFIQFIGLLPGTLGVWHEGNSLKVHVLDLSAGHELALRATERRVADAFVQPLVENT